MYINSIHGVLPFYIANTHNKEKHFSRVAPRTQISCANFRLCLRRYRRLMKSIVVLIFSFICITSFAGVPDTDEAAAKQAADVTNDASPEG